MSHYRYEKSQNTLELSHILHNLVYDKLIKKGRLVANEFMCKKNIC